MTLSILKIEILNTFYLVFNNLDAYFKKTGENMYLIFASREKNKSAMIISTIFKEDDKYYPQILLHDCFYEYEENINPSINPICV